MMAMRATSRGKQSEVILATLEDLVPKNHIVRKMERNLDLTFIYKEVRDYYPKSGKYSLDPVVFFKILLIRYMFGIKSMRETMRQIEVNLAYRWYLGLSIVDAVVHHSTMSKIYYRKFKDSDIFEKVFTKILELAEKQGYVDYEEVFADATHIKACANKNKFEEVKKVVVTVVKKELNDEVNELRAQLGKKKIDLEDFVETGDEETLTNLDEGDEDDDVGPSSGTGTKIIKKEEKIIKKSLNDPESGYYYRDEKEKGFMYQDHRMVCGKHNFIVGTIVLPGNIHDAKALEALIEQVEDKGGKNFSKIALDSGYNSLEIMHTLKQKEKISVIAYRRFGKRKKDKSTYDAQNDRFICALGCVFPLKNVDKRGYKQYHDGKNCENCPRKCYAASEKKKTFQRHIWADLREENTQRRISPEGKELYTKRPQSIERSFADSKQNHGLRWTNYVGRKNNQNYNWMLCSAQNLKKLCKLNAMEYAQGLTSSLFHFTSHVFQFIYSKFVRKFNFA